MSNEYFSPTNPATDPQQISNELIALNKEFQTLRSDIIAEFKKINDRENLEKGRPVESTNFQRNEKLIGEIFFPDSVFTITTASCAQLFKDLKLDKEMSRYLKIVGYTDSKGDESMNNHLSEWRAFTTRNCIKSSYPSHNLVIEFFGAGAIPSARVPNAPSRRASVYLVEFEKKL